MDRKLIAVVLSAVALFAGGIAGALALTDGDAGGSTSVHTMPDGSTMSGGRDSTDTTHTMPDGGEMPGMDMVP